MPTAPKKDGPQTAPLASPTPAPGGVAEGSPQIRSGVTEVVGAETVAGDTPSVQERTNQVPVEEQTPDYVALAAGFQSPMGSTHQGFAKSAGGERTDLSGLVKDNGSGVSEASSDVWEEYTLPGTTEPMYRLIVGKGGTLPTARVDAMKAAGQVAKAQAEKAPSENLSTS